MRIKVRYSVERHYEDDWKPPKDVFGLGVDQFRTVELLLEGASIVNKGRAFEIQIEYLYRERQTKIGGKEKIFENKFYKERTEEEYRKYKILEDKIRQMKGVTYTISEEQKYPGVLGPNFGTIYGKTILISVPESTSMSHYQKALAFKDQLLNNHKDLVAKLGILILQKVKLIISYRI